MGKSRAKHDFAVMVKKFQLAAFFVVLGKDYLKIRTTNGPSRQNGFLSLRLF